METNLFPSSNRINQLTAINIAKIITIIILLGFAFIYDITDSRQIIYLSLHIGYCVWWLLEQWLFPQRRQQIFQDSVNGATLIIIILFVGVFYALPGYFAFNNTNPLNNLTIVFSLTLYIFGSLINTSADVQKMTAKSMNAKLVKDGIWRSVRHVNYLGDLMRYTSFSFLRAEAPRRI